MSTTDLIKTLEEGVREGRIAPYIAAQELHVTADEAGYSEWGVREREVGSDQPERPAHDQPT